MRNVENYLEENDEQHHESLQHEDSYREMAVPVINEPNLRVFVNTDDLDNVPHFHVQQGSYENDEWVATLETRLRLDTAEYLTDTIEDIRLSPEVMKYIVQYFKIPHKRFRHSGGVAYSNWQIMCVSWNNSFGNTQFTPPKQMPNYEQLPTVIPEPLKLPNRFDD